MYHGPAENQSGTLRLVRRHGTVNGYITFTDVLEFHSLLSFPRTTFQLSACQDSARPLSLTVWCHTAASWVKQVAGAESCNYLDRQLQIPDR